MAKKKHKHKPRPKLRNVAPPAPRAPRAPRGPHPDKETAAQRLAYTAMGAAGTALAGAFLAKQNWRPKTIASVLTAVGGGLAWRGDTATIRSIGAGSMAAGGGQLALQMIDDREHAQRAPQKTPPEKKPANAGELPPGAVESAFERARMHMALAMDPYAMDEAA